MSIRRPDRKARLGGLKGRADRTRLRLFALVAIVLMGIPALIGCAGPPEPAGFYHTVRRGENLYRIGRRYGVDSTTLARVNRIRDVTRIQVGQRIFIPRSERNGRYARRPPSRSRSTQPAPDGGASSKKKAIRAAVRREANLDFAWPLEGARLSSRFGWRGRRPHEGIDLAARKGTTIRAAESGKVIYSGRLGDYGKVVIIKHAGHYRSVYAHANRIFVRKGQFVERGQRIAEVGATGNASGPHLHFEIRRGQKAKDPAYYLP